MVVPPASGPHRRCGERQAIGSLRTLTPWGRSSCSCPDMLLCVLREAGGAACVRTCTPAAVAPSSPCRQAAPAHARAQVPEALAI